MDMRIEATAMVADADITDAVVKAVIRIVTQVIVAVGQVASFSCPSISGHSLSAVAPDYNFKEGLALAAA